MVLWRTNEMSWHCCYWSTW